MVNYYLLINMFLQQNFIAADRRCDGLAVFIKEENKRLGGPFEVDMFTNITLEDCQSMCVRAEKYLCRSIEYDEMTKQCILSEEDSISQKDDIDIASSPTHNFYDFTCLDSRKYPKPSFMPHKTQKSFSSWFRIPRQFSNITFIHWKKTGHSFPTVQK